MANNVVESPVQSPAYTPSADTNCSICLGKLKERSLTDLCLHEFCYSCLLQWSKVSFSKKIKASINFDVVNSYL